ncbi:hypothetical protein [Rhizobium leguminosarum]|uniref:hypothetical protein n=1 Tax=Rhizobium leguminosarum TaxID=384 RepID=UPI00037B178B|nr:hypothetical protein [Rhizobium leguminosarum]
MQIDHDPDEPKLDRGPGPWKAVLAVIVFTWIWYLYFQPFNWPSIALGLLTGAGVVAWAIDITGNKIPDSWRGKASRSRRP